MGLVANILEGADLECKKLLKLCKTQNSKYEQGKRKQLTSSI